MFLARINSFFHIYFFPSAYGLLDTKIDTSFYFKDSIINFLEKTFLSSSLRRETEFFKHEKECRSPHPYTFYSTADSASQ